MVKYQFLQIAAKPHLPGEGSKRRREEGNEHEANDYKIKEQRFLNSKRQGKRRGAKKITDTHAITGRGDNTVYK